VITSLIRLVHFSRFLNKEIDRVFEARASGDMTAYWPDIKACYDNLKWYTPFDFNFKRMMVYDHSR
jgi:hypothetical protein